MDADLPFGLWLKKRRKALDLTQSALADRVGCSLATIEKIESEERRPSTQIAELLADALEIPTAERELFLKVARRLKPTDGLASVSPIPFPAPKTTLPAPPTPLIGREEELRGISHLLANADCRLISLVGPGGIGKTRLGIEFANRQRGLFPDGVHYVPLAAVNSAGAIVPAIAEAFAFSFSGPVDPKEQLFDHLTRAIQKSALLVLDNLEHLLAQSSAAAELVAEILQRLPAVRILCTSRERLNLQGEWTFDLRGLIVPPPDASEDVEQFSAAAMFVQAARRADVRFKLTDADKPHLLRICRMVEGIPLALELAAAWVGVLSCEEIAREIESNIDFLATSMRGVPERHRSLRATFDHSWRLLTDAERDALSRLSVFRGGFDRNAAEKISGATLPLLSSLVSKSLVRRTEAGRYDLHEVIRQYALSHLEKESEKYLDTRDMHSLYYLNFAAEREMSLKSALQRYAVQEILGEMDNIRAAWAWMFQREAFEEGCKAIRSLGWFFEVSGLIHEGIDHFEPLVRTLKARPASPALQRVLGEACTQQGILCFRKGLYERAVSLMEESVSLLRPLGDTGLLVDALVYLGIIMHLNGEIDRSQALLEEGLSYARDPKHEWFAAYAIYNLGYVASLRGNYTRGQEQMMEGLTIWRRLGDPHSIALGLNYLVPTLIALGCYDEARAHLQESLELCQASNNRWGMGTAYRHLGWVAKAQGSLEEAQSFLHKSLNTFGDYIIGWDISQTLIVLGETIALTGDCPKAEALLLTALRLARDIHSEPLILQSLAGLASLELRLNPDLAAARLTLILSHPSAPHATKVRAAQLMEGLSAQGESTQTIEQAVEEALQR